MGEFEKILAELSAARTSRNTLDDTLHTRREDLRKLEARISAARRTAAGGDSLQNLLAQRKQLANEIESKKSQFLEVAGRADDLLARLATQSSPQEQVTALNDSIPFLLFPVRLETRFMEIEERDHNRHQLWIRVYPDDINIDTHEPQLTENEAAALQDYWVEVWRAGGDRDGELAAWRALVGGFGAHRAAWMVHTHPPVNASEAPSTPVQEGEDLEVVPELPAMDTKLDSWSRPPRAQLLPDRFVFMGWQDGRKEFEVVGKPVAEPLIVGPAPAPLEEDDLIEQVDDRIRLQSGMKWLADFDEAIEAGMGIKIDLETSRAEAGFDQIIVLGLRLSADKQEGAQQLERLFESHHYSSDGFSLLPQGVATNSTESSGADYSSFDLGEETSFEVEASEDLFSDAENWTEKADGQFLAECLGIDSSVFRHIQYSNGYDQRDARAMNTALWPATLGYFMEEMMHPAFSMQNIIPETRTFFIDYVRGRGMAPSIRKGKQPYGILPASVLSRWKYPGGGDLDQYEFYGKLHTVLARVDEDWQTMADSVSYAGKEDDPYQILLDILGLHAGSVQFHSRQMIGAEYLWNYLQLNGSAGLALDWYMRLFELGRGIFEDLGYSFEELPAIWEKVLFEDHTDLDGPVIDDLPLSETDPIRDYSSDEQNYIEWLRNSDLDTITNENFGEGGSVPQALLYLLLRHAVLLSYWESTVNIQSPGEPLAKTEQELLYMSADDRWNGKLDYLNSLNPAVTGSSNLSVGRWLDSVDLTSLSEAANFAQVKTALDQLQYRPTAALERAFTEHLDLCSYRLDAWKLGLIHHRLEELRQPAAGDSGKSSWRKGIYLGGFGWLENLRPSDRKVEEVSPNEVPSEFRHSSAPPLVRDSANAGYVHAPSLGHAVTGAVLRNAYLVHADEDGAESFSVNLSSERVRRALAMIEGVRHGQEVAELLGYQLERALHDRSIELIDGLDQYIYPLRQEFPLYEDQATGEDDDGKNSASQARNVMNGVALLEHIRDSGAESYPWGKTLDDSDPVAGSIIDEEVSRMADTLDAVGDLSMAEGVYQVVQGNYDRAGSMLKAVSEGKNPPIPEIVRTPRSGHTLTQRTVLQFEARTLDYVLTDADLPYGGVADASPRARAEFGLNKWLSEVLPPLEDVRFTAKLTDTDGAESEVGPYSFLDAGLQPIDVIYLMAGKPAEQFESLDAVLAYYVRTSGGLEDAVQVSLEYSTRHSSFAADPTVVTIFELAPLVSHLHRLIAGSRPLSAEDFVPAAEENEEGTGKQIDLAELAQRVAAFRSELAAVLGSLIAAIPPFEEVAAVAGDPEPVPTASEFGALRDALHALARYGIANALPRSATDTTLEAKDTLLMQASSLKDAVTASLEEYNDLVPAADDSEDTQTEKWIEASRKLFGGGFRLIPGFLYSNPTELQNAHSKTSDPAFLGESSSPLPLDDWLHGIARVRPKMRNLEMATLLAEQFGRAELDVLPFQLPYSADATWVGHEVPSDHSWEGDTLLVNAHLAAGFSHSVLQAGLVLDDWTESVPTQEETTGVAFHFDRPNSEPPNVLILAVTPEITGSWSWDDLVDTLRETLEMARKRAVEPEQIDDSSYAQLLPATMIAVTRYLSTISANLLRNVSNDEILNQG